jgi:XTP/dITP diphosphohydrolase
MKSFCFATNNSHKIEEIRALLGPFFQLKSLEDIGCFEELAETQPTIEGNSLQKAQYVFHNYQVSCFADDTGLEVNALQGEPGVLSARYAGENKSSEDNITLLLKNLQNCKDRKARFKTIITLVQQGSVNVFEGIVWGEILFERRGTMGFGYDSVFKPDGFDKTFAEMSLSDKNLISHRAMAVKKLINFLINSTT